MRRFICLLSAFIPLSFASAGEWPQFRGPAGTGVSTETKVPLNWSSTQNVVWKAELPAPGNGSPIVWGDSVFVTVATERGKNRGLISFDRASGKQRWIKTVTFSGEDPTHGTNPHGSATPTTDGQRVIAWHSSAGLHCYDMAGNEQWSRDLGEFRHIWGYGSSPVIHGDRVLLNAGPGKRQFLIALDKLTGKTLWQVDEPGGDSGEAEDGGRGVWTGSWSTPLVAKIDGLEQVVVSYPKHIQGYSLKDGSVLWTVAGLGALVYSDPLLGSTHGVSMSGFHGPAIGFKLGGAGDVTQSNLLWTHRQGNPQRIASGVLIGQHVYMANENGTVQCFDVVTGEDTWKDRVQARKIWGSTLAAEGRLYITNDNSTTYVVAADPKEFKLLATNELNEPTNSTPAFSNGQVFHRTFKHLYCIAEK